MDAGERSMYEPTGDEDDDDDMMNGDVDMDERERSV
jgi:hypothetical protein